MGDFVIKDRRTYQAALEAGMTAVTFLGRSAAEMTCNKCGNSRIAPEWSFDFIEEGSVIYFWSCVDCGDQFETEEAAVDARPKMDKKPFDQSALLLAA